MNEIADRTESLPAVPGLDAALLGWAAALVEAAGRDARAGGDALADHAASGPVTAALGCGGVTRYTPFRARPCTALEPTSRGIPVPEALE